MTHTNSNQLGNKHHMQCHEKKFSLSTTTTSEACHELLQRQTPSSYQHHSLFGFHLQMKQYKQVK